MRNLWRGLPAPLLALLIPALLSCSVIYPPIYQRTSSLSPRGEQGDSFSVGEGGTVSFGLEGLRIDVEHMTDQELNDLFPAESSEGEYSTNPYTYGDYIDPAVGYVRNRFTVFRVTVHNYSFAKVELQPLRSFLTTDRPGELLEPYGVLAGSSTRNFESYYRSLRGPSGNEYYRFNMRMGLVRTNNYGVGERIFRGEEYGGFIVFDPLDSDVEGVRLNLRDFVLKFNTFGKPLETIDIGFDFDRRIEVAAYQEQRQSVSREVSRAELSPGTRVVGNVTGDITRDVTAVEAHIKSRLDELNECFARESLAGRASEGEVSVRFVILPPGTVAEAEVTSSTVVSEAVGGCMAARMRAWRFRPSGGPMRGEGAAADTAGTGSPGGRPAPGLVSQVLQGLSARVTVDCTLQFMDTRAETAF